MARYCVRMEGPSACVATVVREVQVGRTVPQQSIDSATPGTETEYVWSYRGNDTERVDTFCDVLYYAILITMLFRSGAEQYASNIFKLPHCNSFDIEAIHKTLKTVISCSELGRKTPVKYLKTKDYGRRS